MEIMHFVLLMCIAFTVAAVAFVLLAKLLPAAENKKQAGKKNK